MFPATTTNEVCLLPVTGSSSLVWLMLIATVMLAAGLLLRRWTRCGVGIAAVVAAVAVAVAGLSPVSVGAATDDCPPETTVASGSSVAPATSATPTTSGPAVSPSTTAASDSPSTTAAPESPSTTAAEDTTTTSVSIDTTTTEPDLPSTTLVQPSSETRCVAQLPINSGGSGEIVSHYRFVFVDGVGSVTVHDAADSECSIPGSGSLPAVWSSSTLAPQACAEHHNLSFAVAFNGVADFAPAIPDTWIWCR